MEIDEVSLVDVIAFDDEGVPFKFGIVDPLGSDACFVGACPGSASRGASVLRFFFSGEDFFRVRRQKRQQGQRGA